MASEEARLTQCDPTGRILQRRWGLRNKKAKLGKSNVPSGGHQKHKSKCIKANGLGNFNPPFGPFTTIGSSFQENPHDVVGALLT